MRPGPSRPVRALSPAPAPRHSSQAVWRSWARRAWAQAPWTRPVRPRGSAIRAWARAQRAWVGPPSNEEKKNTTRAESINASAPAKNAVRCSLGRPGPLLSRPSVRAAVDSIPTAPCYHQFQLPQSEKTTKKLGRSYQSLSSLDFNFQNTNFAVRHAELKNRSLRCCRSDFRMCESRTCVRSLCLKRLSVASDIHHLCVASLSLDWPLVHSFLFPDLVHHV